LSVPYTVARALVDGRVGLDSFGPAQVADPRVQALLPKIDVAPTADIPPNDLAPVRVTIALLDGRVLRCDIESLLGSRRRPLDRSARVAKTQHCWQFASQPAWRGPEKLVHAVETLGAAPNLAALWAAMGA
ncbi:MAG: MmgE/PrpD family protein, partial [Dehalococcoidia bacterium]|nr:MmgE/PrpD family protein [Dehalococcoidia bacterium]